jgi:predicted enzyme related to lactoylglutathione lyase
VISLSTVNLGASDPHALALFYGALLGWEVAADEPQWVLLRNPDGGVALSFQTEEHHVPPVWPGEAGAQQMQAHLEIEVDDLDTASARAVELGATVAAYQPQPDVRVHLDPQGHPFCLWVAT